MHATIITQIRLPRLVLGIAVGASLGICGAAMQGLFRNPLADPGLLGVSAGAALGAVAASILGGVLLHSISAQISGLLIPLSAFIGGLIATLLVFRLGQVDQRTNVATMLLAGIAINAIATAAMGLLKFIADDQALRGVVFWMMGGLGHTGWDRLSIALPIMLLAAAGITFFAQALNALLLGEAEATHLGFRVERTKQILILLVSLCVGLAVSLSGVIGFVGLVVPHILRLIIGPDHRYLLPGSALFGAILLVGADWLARSVIAPAEIPIGIITALVGGPFFIGLLLSSKYR